MSNLSDAARLLAAQRRRVAGNCAFCGKVFMATPRRRYCSNTCNVRALRQAKRAQQPNPVKERSL